MELISSNEKLIDVLSSQFTILSGSLEKVCIYQNDLVLCIDLYINLQYSDRNNCVLKFIDVKEYAFYHNSDTIFYNIERFKLFKSEDLYYISLDPYDEGPNINENDQDFILSGAIEGYLITE